MLFLFIMVGFINTFFGTTVHAAQVDNQAEPVRVEEIDYEEGYIQIATNHNTKVYFSDSSKSTWSQIEGDIVNGKLYFDISWISIKSDYELNLKGSDDKTVETICLPAYDSTLAVKFDKLTGTLDITSETYADTFEWRKDSENTSWKQVPMDLEKTEDANVWNFLQNIESMRAKGGKIQVRIPQQKGTSVENVGCRPSKTVKVSISKRGNAPTSKVTANKLMVNTTTKQEYRVYAVDGVLQNRGWTECEKNMTLKELVPEVLAKGTTAGSDVVVAIRKSQTESIPYSKTFYLKIPKQEIAPEASAVSIIRTSKKYGIIIDGASTVNPYQYAVVKAGVKKEEDDLSWKTVKSNKEISFSLKTYLDGSIIYVRKMGNNASSKTELKLPSAYTKITISHLTE